MCEAPTSGVANRPARKITFTMNSPCRLALLFTLAFTPLVRAQTDSAYRLPSPALAAVVDAPLTPTVIVSPDKQFLVLAERSALPPIAELAQPELRLAGHRINRKSTRLNSSHANISYAVFC